MGGCRRLARTGCHARAPDRPPTALSFSAADGGTAMADTNRGVVYTGPECRNPRPRLPQAGTSRAERPAAAARDPEGRRHQHLRLRPAHGARADHRPEGQTLGHEITGEVAEVGRDVEFIKQGDLVSVPFNIACGAAATARSATPGSGERQPGPGRRRLRLCRHGRLARRPGRVRDRPYADWNLLKFPDRDQAMAKIGPGHAVGHLPDRLPRRLDRRGDHHRLCRRRRPGRPGLRHLGPPAGRGRGHRRRHERRPPAPGGQLRLRDHQPVGTDDVQGALQQILGGSGEVDAAVDCVGFGPAATAPTAPKARPRRPC